MQCKQKKFREVLAAAVVAGAAMLASPALAQDYPQRPIRMIVGFPPGGMNDIMGRIVAAKLGERLRQQVVVDNRAGASGMIGADLVAKSQPDGYTLLTTGSSISTINSLYPKAPFNAAKDLEPIAWIATLPYIFVVPSSLPVMSMSDFIAYAKAHPGKLNYAGSAPGTVQHLSGELLKRIMGIDMVYVPYKGTGAVIPDLLSGRLQAAIETVLIMVPHIKSGVLRGLGVTSAKRSAVIPELPTIAEVGVPDFQAIGCIAVFAAAKTPPQIVRKLNAEIAAFMNEPELRDRLLGQGAEPVSGPPDILRNQLARDMEVWGKVIREAGLKAE